MRLFIITLLISSLIFSAQPSHEAKGRSNHTYYFPVVFGGNSPMGTYLCAQMEFGMFLFREELTLLAGGQLERRKEFTGPVITSTWQYDAVTQEVTLTNHRPPTATFISPNVLYVVEPNEIMTYYSCHRRV